MLGKFGLTILHFLLGIGVSGIFLVDTYGLAFFFGMEAEVFEQEYLAGLEAAAISSAVAQSSAKATSVPRA